MFPIPALFRGWPAISSTRTSNDPLSATKSVRMVAHEPNRHRSKPGTKTITSSFRLQGREVDATDASVELPRFYDCLRSPANYKNENQDRARRADSGELP